MTLTGAGAAHVRVVLALLFVAYASVAAGAQDDPAVAAPPPTSGAVNRTVRFLGGAAAGLLIHEAGHVTFAAALDAHPGVKRISYGPLPFFAIDHARVSRRKEYVVSAAGLWFQQASAEWILTSRPRLRQESAPGLKGVFAFHLATSTVYSVAAFGHFGPPERDTRGMAVSLGRRGVPEPIVGVLVLAPAALDGYRYLRPDCTWAKWASRASKVAGVVLTLAAGR